MALIMGKNPLPSMGFYPFGGGSPLTYCTAMEKTFRQALVDHLTNTGTKPTELAAATGIKKDTIYAVTRGTTRNMNVEHAIRIAAYFGETVEQFMGMSPRDVDKALLAQISNLSPEERQILSASIAALTASRHPSPPASDQDEAQAAPAVPSTNEPSNPIPRPPKKADQPSEQ